ncbi:hypothetical protein JIP62_08595 [Brevundimonas vitis]|uniref:Uncharacterized protein n=1 Tax=Brevundimonas vitisensis TaxID=2800818 RepID=A0ABX7BM49_9CAUL|nr:hypothetical protein [Brevundimonas vitisensis]QQQ17416.1 hypothetical protein JIP62_08595 [Brevundimonas vitisensis]
MSDYYFSMALGNRRSLCISPLTNEELASGEGRPGNGLGYFLYERDEADDGLNVLAKIVSEDAAVRLYQAIREASGGRLAEAA